MLIPAPQVKPYYTDRSIQFLEEHLKGVKGLSVFEYGSGYSTLWWAKRARAVVACEHDPAWEAKLKPSLPRNVKHMLRQQLGAQGDYYRAILEWRVPFDIVVN